MTKKGFSIMSPMVMLVLAVIVGIMILVILIASFGSGSGSIMGFLDSIVGGFAERFLGLLG